MNRNNTAVRPRNLKRLSANEAIAERRIMTVTLTVVTKTLFRK